jgi:hypothetical protein
MMRRSHLSWILVLLSTIHKFLWVVNPLSFNLILLLFAYFFFSFTFFLILKWTATMNFFILFFRSLCFLFYALSSSLLIFSFFLGLRERFLIFLHSTPFFFFNWEVVRFFIFSNSLDTFTRFKIKEKKSLEFSRHFAHAIFNFLNLQISHLNVYDFIVNIESQNIYFNSVRLIFPFCKC